MPREFADMTNERHAFGASLRRDFEETAFWWLDK